MEHEGLKLTKKQKMFKVIDFRNFNILNLKANIFHRKMPFFEKSFSKLHGGGVGEGWC
jgi:hypothetical protein